VTVIKVAIIGSFSNAPHAKIALERGRSKKHAIHSQDIGGVPTRDVLIEGERVPKHGFHRRDGRGVPIADGMIKCGSSIKGPRKILHSARNIGDGEGLRGTNKSAGQTYEAG
jgi:hypothetical protein